MPFTVGSIDSCTGTDQAHDHIRMAPVTLLAPSQASVVAGTSGRSTLESFATTNTLALLTGRSLHSST